MTIPAIKAEGISKLYRLEHGGAGSKTFRELLTDMATAPLRRFRQIRVRRALGEQRPGREAA